MEGFFDFNLWMFFVIGILGCAFCYLRFGFIWWVTPIVILISVIFLFNVAEIDSDVGIARTPNSLHVVVSILFAIALPLLGAFLGRPTKRSSQQGMSQ